MNQHTVYQITAVSDPYPGELGGRSYLSRIEAENALRRYDVGCQRIAEHECADPADSLEALYRAMRLNHPATVEPDNHWRCDLPTFGGEPPADTDAIWSWDERHLLVGTCADDLEIVGRGE